MTSTKLKTQHTSLQFSDTRAQQEKDVEKLFAKGADYHIKTGTESSVDNALRDLVLEAARDYNHVISFGRGNWVAVDREIIRKGTAKRGSIFVISNDRMEQVKGHDRVLATVSFVHEEPGVGRIAQAATHYSTKGQFPGSPNHDVNRITAHRIYEWMQEESQGPDLAFVNGDFNMPDPRTDWAFGKEWTSMADELKAWQNTGHGPIDGFASFDRDRRVRAVSFKVLDDSEMFMHSDHFVCRGVWDIRHVKTSN